jgi:pSer/pThr/pTyr-binding forkhead associated (FHA) protein
MAKLVILNQGMTGRTFELNVERNTVGRVDDNTFQIADASVSSHHAEILLRGADIVIKDLNSTNGTYLNNEKVSEVVLKPGQTLRFGQVELKIDDGKPVTAPPPAPVGAAPAPAAAAPKRQVDSTTLVIPRGVSLSDLEQGGTRPASFDTNTAFSKKTNKVNRYFLIVGIIVFVVIVVLIVINFSAVNGSHK